MIGKIIGVSLLGYVTVQHIYEAGKFGGGYKEPAKSGDKQMFIHLADAVVTAWLAFAWFLDW